MAIVKIKLKADAATEMVRGGIHSPGNLNDGEKKHWNDLRSTVYRRIIFK